LIPLTQETNQIIAKREPFHGSAQNSKRCREPQFISHHSLAVLLLKSMAVFEAPEHARRHHILKKYRWFVSRDSACMAQHEAKVPPAPGYRLALSEQSGCDSGDRAFSGRRCAVHMEIDAQREKKASHGRSGDPRLELNCLHD
jgi:hypothetical protein